MLSVISGVILLGILLLSEWALTIEVVQKYTKGVIGGFIAVLFFFLILFTFAAGSVMIVSSFMV